MAYIEQNFDGHSWSAPVQANPLGDNIKMQGFDIGTNANNQALRMGGVFDGRYLWASCHENGLHDVWGMTRVDVRSGEYTYFPMTNGVNGNAGLADGRSYYCCAYDGTDVWLNPYGNPTVRLDPSTGRMTGYSVEGGSSQSTYSAVIVDSYVWYFDHYTNKAYRLDPATGVTKYFDIPIGSGRNFQVIITDGTDLWLIPFESTTTWNIMQIKLSDNQVVTCHEYPIYGMDTGNLESLLDGSGRFSMSAYFLNGSIWMAPARLNRLVRFDIASKASTFFSLEEGSNGNSNMGTTAHDGTDKSFTRSTAMTYDGEYLWMPSIGRLVRIDPASGTMRGYNIEGDDLGSIPLAGWAFVFDGTNLWSIPSGTRTHLIKISPDKTVHGVEEQYHTGTGDVIKLSTLTWVDAGDDYAKAAPHIGGYVCIGYTIDGGELISSATATIDNVHADHDVVFIYTEADPSLTATITHQYQTENGTPIQPDTTHSALIGQAYTATRPAIPGYTYQGHRIDGGALQTGATATIPDVQGSHTITFVYKKDEDSGGSEPGDDGKCCCTCVTINGVDIHDFTIEHLHIHGCSADCRDSDCGQK